MVPLVRGSGRWLDAIAFGRPVGDRRSRLVVHGIGTLITRKPPDPTSFQEMLSKRACNEDEEARLPNM